MSETLREVRLALIDSAIDGAIDAEVSLGAPGDPASRDWMKRYARRVLARAAIVNGSLSTFVAAL